MLRRLLSTITIGITLGGCAGGGSLSTGQPTASSFTVNADATNVARAIQSGVSGYSLQPVGAGGTRFQGQFASNSGVAECAPIRVKVQDKTRVVSAESGVIDVALLPSADGSSTQVTVAFLGTYRPPSTTATRQAPCRSTGLIEGKLQAAVVGT